MTTFQSQDHVKLIIETLFDHILQAEKARTLIQVLRSSKVIPMISLVEIKKEEIRVGWPVSSIC